jgi:hypothetical protein
MRRFKQLAALDAPNPDPLPRLLATRWKAVRGHLKREGDGPVTGRPLPVGA